MDHSEKMQAIRLRKLTGKSIKTCHMCLKWHRGNFSKALEMCSNDPPAEDGRQSENSSF